MIEPHSACGATGPGGGASEGRFSRTPPGLGEGPPRPRPRRSPGFPLPRPLPWSTPLSRAWPGTLIACWTVLTTCVILSPRWSTLAIVGGLLLLASLVVRLPLGVAPRPPMWFVSGFIGGCIGAWLGDGLELFLRPLRLLGAPVDQWSLVMASALRGMPMLRDQAQAVLDTAKLRLGQDMATLSLRGYVRLSVDVITAILSATSRGAAETGRAMSMRGAIESQDGATRGARVRLGWVDAAVIAVSLLGVAGIVACRLML